MATVNVYDLFLMAAQLLKDNVELVDITDDDSFLSFEVPSYNDDLPINYGSIDDVYSPDADIRFTFSQNSIAPFVATFKELSLTHNAFINTINCCLEELDSKTISAEERSLLRTRLKELEDYKNSLESFLSKVQGLGKS